MNNQKINYYNKHQGYSLLEIILVLAVIGAVMATSATWLRKRADETARQTAAEALAREVYGVLQFIHSDTLLATVNNQTRKLVNPLYQLPGDPVYGDNLSPDPAPVGILRNPLFLLHPRHDAAALAATSPALSPYLARVWSGLPTAPLERPPPGITSHPLKWSQARWRQESVRAWFTDSGCQAATGGGAGGGPVWFNQSFLSCGENPLLSNGIFSIARIDLINSRGTVSRDGAVPPREISVAIDRVDIYVQFTPADGNPAGIVQALSPLVSALRAKGIAPDTDAMWLVGRRATDPADRWTFTSKTGAAATRPEDLIRFSEIPDHLNRLRNDSVYAVRFSFNGNGNYLSTDGINSATRVCWNTAEGAAAPCLSAPSRDTLVVRQRQRPRELANLQAGDMISTVSRSNADGTRDVEEYYTAPRIRYAAFAAEGAPLAPYYRNPADRTTVCTTEGGCGGQRPYTMAQITSPDHGAIAVPLQTCPGAWDENDAPVPLHPRLSAAVSSAIAGIRKNAGGDVQPDAGGPYLGSQETTMPRLIENIPNVDVVSINRLGGVILQITQDAASQEWRIAAMVGAEDTGIHGHAWQYYNPPWLSVMVTTWCSSIEQP